MIGTVPTPQPLRALPPRLREHLSDDLVVTVSTTLRLERDDDAPDVTFYDVRIMWQYTLGYSTDEDDRQATAWAATHGGRPNPDGQTEVALGSVTMATISRYAVNGIAQLDSISGDYEALGTALFADLGAGTPFARTVEGYGGLALLIADVELAEPFHGHRVEVAVVDRLLTHFEDACGCALLLETGTRSPTGAGRHARAEPTGNWAEIGFENLTEDVVAVDLGLTRPGHPGDGGLRTV